MSKKTFLKFSALFIILRFFIAALVPLGNDEVIYWDFGRFLQLSYVEHPPGVALVSWLSQFLFGWLHPNLGSRGLVILLHFSTCFILLSCVKTDKQRAVLFTLMQFVPAFSLGSLLLLPDAGLLFFLALVMLQENRQAPYSLNAVAKTSFLIGCAFLFKYHAGIVYVVYLGFLFLRKDSSQKSFVKFKVILMSLLIFTAVISPVLIWNLQNHYASLIFQGSRAGGSWNFSGFFRTIAAQALLLSPLFFWEFLRSLSVRQNFKNHVYTAGGTLVAVFSILALNGQVLPHWLIPGWWLMLLPVLYSKNLELKSKPMRWNKVFAIGITFTVVFFTAFPRIRQIMVRKILHNKPGAFGELTFWPEITKNSFVLQAFEQSQNTGCKEQYLFSYRWYEVAHLSFSLPGQPFVRSLANGLESNYSLRDQNYKIQPGCLFVVLTEETFLDDLPKHIVKNSQIQKVVLKNHLDRPFVILTGKIPEELPPKVEIFFTPKTPEKLFQQSEITVQKKYSANCEDCLTDLNAVQFKAQNPLKIGHAQKYSNYSGIFHSHTGFSDGKKTPREAFAMARDLAHLDFAAVTEHPEYWLFSDLGKWEQIAKIATDESRSNFIALRGFEWSHIISGHYVVLNSPKYCGAEKCTNLADFYRWLELSENKNAAAFFAHPGFLKSATELLEFNLFEGATDALSKILVGMEVIHWDGYRPFLKGPLRGKPYFETALDKNWRLGPMGAQDNHSANWGMSGTNRTVILAENLSLESILDALKNHRFFATKNENLHFNFEVKVAEVWLPMGSSTVLNPDFQEFSIALAEPDDQKAVSRLEIILNSKIIKKFIFHENFANSPKLSGEITFKLQTMGLPAKNYIFVRLYQGENEFYFTQSAPIFLDKN